MENNKEQQPCLKCKLVLLAGVALSVRYIYEGVSSNEVIFIFQGSILLVTTFILVKFGSRFINLQKKNENK